MTLDSAEHDADPLVGDGDVARCSSPAWFLVTVLETDVLRGSHDLLHDLFCC